jgi:hypothetical protein
MSIEGLEYNTNQWDGLGKGKGGMNIRPRPGMPGTPRPGVTAPVVAPKPEAPQTVGKPKPDPIVTAITGVIDKFRTLFGWK